MLECIFSKVRITLPVVVVALIFAIFGGQRALAETLYATTVNNDLVSFESGDTCSILTMIPINGLQPDESILGIDFRPANGQLYGLGSSSRIYVIDPSSGIATAVGSGPFTPSLSGDSFGFDFNPTVDRIRIVSNTGQNLRAHPDLGTIVFTDADLGFASGDLNFGAVPTAVAAAYTNPDRDPLTGTTLYDIDSALDILVIQNPPNNGVLNSVGTLGINTNDLAGFDISTTNVGYAALKESGKTKVNGRRCGSTTLFTVNLVNGEVINSGSIGTNQPVTGLAAYIAP